MSIQELSFNEVAEVSGGICPSLCAVKEVVGNAVNSAISNTVSTAECIVGKGISFVTRPRCAPILVTLPRLRRPC